MIYTISSWRKTHVAAVELVRAGQGHLIRIPERKMKEADAAAGQRVGAAAVACLDGNGQKKVFSAEGAALSPGPDAAGGSSVSPGPDAAVVHGAATDAATAVGIDLGSKSNVGGAADMEGLDITEPDAAAGSSLGSESSTETFTLRKRQKDIAGHNPEATSSSRKRQKAGHNAEATSSSRKRPKGGDLGVGSHAGRGIATQNRTKDERNKASIKGVMHLATSREPPARWQYDDHRPIVSDR